MVWHSIFDEKIMQAQLYIISVCLGGNIDSEIYFYEQKYLGTENRTVEIFDISS